MNKSYANGTSLETRDGYVGGYVRGRALCDDGVVRAVRFPKGGHADTFFSVPACCTAFGKYVDGFVTVSTVSGSDVATDDDPAIVRFRAFDYAKNAHVIKRPVFVEVGGVEELDDASDIATVGAALEAEGYTRTVEASHRELLRPWQHDGEGDRIHYIEVVNGTERHLWCEPGHADYDEVLELLTSPVTV
jgi:hypothetical protein